jgi:hypothetical protein
VNCGQVRERWDQWLDGELEGAERADVAAHLGACPDCRNLYDRQERVEGLMLTLGRAADRIVEARRARRPLGSLLRMAAAVAIVTSAGITASWWLAGRNVAPVPAPRPVVKAGTDRPGGFEADPAPSAALAIAESSPGLAVRLRCENPRVQIVMFYEPVGGPASREPTTTAPQL